MQTWQWHPWEDAVVTQDYVAPLPNDIEMHRNRVNTIYIVDGILYSRHAKCIQGSKGQHHHCRGDAVLCLRDAVCAKCHSNIMDGCDRCCINNRVVAGITWRCLGRMLRDGVCHRHIDHLPPGEKKPPEKMHHLLPNGWYLCKAWYNTGKWRRLIGSAGRDKKKDLIIFTDPFHLIWMMKAKKMPIEMKGWDRWNVKLLQHGQKPLLKGNGVRQGRKRQGLFISWIKQSNGNVKLAQTDHGGRWPPMATMVPPPKRQGMTTLANMLLTALTLGFGRERNTPAS